jgi:ribosomal protein L37AE/L43A
MPKSKKSKKEKMFKVRECPKCKSDDVGVLLGGEGSKGSGKWECHKCEWSGSGVNEKELSEDDFMKYLDDPKKSEIFGAAKSVEDFAGKGEEVS